MSESRDIRKLLTTPFYRQRTADQLFPVVIEFLREADILPSSSSGPMKVSHLVALNDFFDSCRKEKILSEGIHIELYSRISAFANEEYTAKRSLLRGGASQQQQPHSVSAPHAAGGTPVITNTMVPSASSFPLFPPVPDPDAFTAARPPLFHPPVSTDSYSPVSPFDDQPAVSDASVARSGPNAVPPARKRGRPRRSSTENPTTAPITATSDSGQRRQQISLEDEVTTEEEEEEEEVKEIPKKKRLSQASEKAEKKNKYEPRLTRFQQAKTEKGKKKKEGPTKYAEVEGPEAHSNLEAIEMALKTYRRVCEPQEIVDYINENDLRGRKVPLRSVVLSLEKRCRGPESPFVFIKPGFALRDHVIRGWVRVPQGETLESLTAFEGGAEDGAAEMKSENESERRELGSPTSESDKKWMDSDYDEGPPAKPKIEQKKESAIKTPRPSEFPKQVAARTIGEAVVQALTDLKRICISPEIAEYIKQNKLRDNVLAPSVASICSILSFGPKSPLLFVKPGFVLRSHVEEGVVLLPPGKTIADLTRESQRSLRSARKDEGEGGSSSEEVGIVVGSLPRSRTRTPRNRESKSEQTPRKNPKLHECAIQTMENLKRVCTTEDIRNYIENHELRSDYITQAAISRSCHKYSKGRVSLFLNLGPAGFVLRKHVVEGVVALPEGQAIESLNKRSPKKQEGESESEKSPEEEETMDVEESSQDNGKEREGGVVLSLTLLDSPEQKQLEEFMAVDISAFVVEHEQQGQQDNENEKDMSTAQSGTEQSTKFTVVEPTPQVLSEGQRVVFTESCTEGLQLETGQADILPDNIPSVTITSLPSERGMESAEDA